MKQFLKIGSLLVAICLLGILVACQTNEPCITHIDADEDGICDVCGEEFTVEIPKVTVTFTMEDQEETPIEGAEISLWNTAEPDAEVATATGTSNAQGLITVTIAEGEYKVQVDVMPNGYLCAGTTVSVSAEENTFPLDAQCTIPNGTEERPYPITDTKLELTFPAGETYYFSILGSDQILKIENADVELCYKENVYTPDENGVIEILTVAEGASREREVFSIVNKADADNFVSISYEPRPGTVNNPYAIEALESSIMVEDIPNGQSVYYAWTATQSGVLMVTSPEVHNMIMLYNTTTMAVSSYTNGAESVSVNVNAGDEISVIVSSISSEETSDVSFVLSMQEG